MDRLHRISGAAKRILPEFIWSPARRILTALLTPLRFSLDTGHFRSSLKAAAVDRRGEPLPWYTYPAIDFLGTQDFSGRSVLEFGAGNSTLWWARRARSVTSIESDADWFASLQTLIPANASLSKAVGELDFSAIPQHAQFDLIVIDGMDRLAAAKIAPAIISHDGAIVLDNSEGGWGSDGEPGQPILDLLRSLGFMRVDFYGFTPGVIGTHCTSIFFKSGSFVVAGDFACSIR